jgi:hypothetical protein
LSWGSRGVELGFLQAAPAFFPEVHEQALRRIRPDLDLVPVEFPSTRGLARRRSGRPI